MMSSNKLITFLITISLLSIILSLTVTAFDINVTSPSSHSYLRGLTTLNATFNESYTITNVTFRWNLSGSLVYNFTIYNNTAADTVFDNSSFNTSLLSDGTYNLSVLAYNSTGSTAINNSIVNITVDNTAPTITLINSSFSTNDTTPQLFFNYTDTNLRTQTCSLYLNNVTYGNLSSTANATTLNITVNSTLTDNAYTTLINCTDAAGNIGTSNSITVTVDTTAPSVSLSKSSSSTDSLTIAISTSSDATCTASSGSISGSGASQTLSASSLSSATTYAFTVTCTDAVGYSASATGSFQTDASTQGGTSLEGTLGGVTRGVPNQFEKKVWYTINKGETANIQPKGDISITNIQFKTAKKAVGPWLEVTKLKKLPSDVLPITQTNYQYLKIVQRNIVSALEGTAKINFKVSKQWLNQNKLAPDNVALYHYLSKEWVILPTSLAKEDESTVYYQSETSTFSYFAVAEGTAPKLEITPITIETESSSTTSSISSPTGAAVTETSSSSSTTSSSTSPSSVKQTVKETENPPVSETTSSSGIPWWVWLIGIVLIFVIIVVLVWWLKGGNQGPSNYNNYSNNYNNYNNF